MGIQCILYIVNLTLSYFCSKKKHFCSSPVARQFPIMPFIIRFQNVWGFWIWSVSPAKVTLIEWNLEGLTLSIGRSVCHTMTDGPTYFLIYLYFASSFRLIWSDHIHLMTWISVRDTSTSKTTCLEWDILLYLIWYQVDPCLSDESKNFGDAVRYKKTEWRNKSSSSENAVFPPLGDASQFGMNYCQIFLFNHNKPRSRKE